MKDEVKTSYFSQGPKNKQTKSHREKTSSDNWNFSSGTNFCSLSHILCSAVQPRGLANTTYPKAVGCVSWSRGCLRDFWFCYALNQCLANVEMPGESAAVRPVSLVYPGDTQSVFLW